MWRKELENRSGTLSDTLEPLARAGADLQVVMGYCYPGAQFRAEVELCPVVSKKITTAAESAGLSASGIPAVHFEGDNRAGLGHSIAHSLAEAGVNLDFLVAQVVGRKYSAVIGFENDADATKAISLIKKAANKRK